MTPNQRAHLVTRLAQHARPNIDLIAGVLGAALTIAALTELFGWQWAMLAAGLALIAVAMVVPT